MSTINNINILLELAQTLAEQGIRQALPFPIWIFGKIENTKQERTIYNIHITKCNLIKYTVFFHAETNKYVVILNIFYNRLMYNVCKQTFWPVHIQEGRG